MRIDKINWIFAKVDYYAEKPNKNLKSESGAIWNTKPWLAKISKWYVQLKNIELVDHDCRIELMVPVILDVSIYGKW